jgi:hypothetical protein
VRIVGLYAHSAFAIVQATLGVRRKIVESISEGRTGLLRVNLLKSGYRDYLLLYRSKVSYLPLI